MTQGERETKWMETSISLFEKAFSNYARLDQSKRAAAPKTNFSEEQGKHWLSGVINPNEKKIIR